MHHPYSCPQGHEKQLVLFWLKHWLDVDCLDEYDEEISTKLHGCLDKHISDVEEKRANRRFCAWAKDNFQL